MEPAHVQARFAYAVARVLNSGLSFAGASALAPAQRFLASGSAVLFRVEPDGTLLYITNRHVVADTIDVTINMPSWGALTLPARVVGTHAARDVAVICVANVPAAIAQLRAAEPAGATEATRASARVAAWYADTCARNAPEAADTRSAAIEGLPCCALGYPLGQESLNATTGTITKIQVFGTTAAERLMLTIDAGINHGNSGGGLWVLAPGATPGAAPRVLYAGMPSSGVEGTNVLGYAIPASDALSVANALCILSAKAGGTFINADGPFLDLRTSAPPESVLVPTLGERAAAPAPAPALARASLYVAEVGACSALAPAVTQGSYVTRIGSASIDTLGCAQLAWLASTPGAYVGLTPEQAAATFEVNVPITVEFADGRTQTVAWDMLVNAPVRMRDAYLDPAPIEIICGVTLTEMSLNMLEDSQFMAGAPWLREHGAPAMRRTGALVVIGVPGVGPLADVPTGSYLFALNGTQLACMADYRVALAALAAPGASATPLRLTFGQPRVPPRDYVFDSVVSVARTTIALGSVLHQGASLTMASIVLRT